MRGGSQLKLIVTEKGLQERGKLSPINRQALGDTRRHLHGKGSRETWSLSCLAP